MGISKGGEQMEQETMLKEILKALELHSNHMHSKMQEMENRLDAKMQAIENRLDAKMKELESRLETKMQEMGNQLRAEMQQMVENLEEKMNKRFDRLETKVDGLRIELRETQETVDFLSSKTIQHERKIRDLYRQQ
jgi:ABC-type phosphate transport system auxiliary subunit